MVKLATFCVQLYSIHDLVTHSAAVAFFSFETLQILKMISITVRAEKKKAKPAQPLREKWSTSQRNLIQIAIKQNGAVNLFSIFFFPCDTKNYFLVKILRADSRKYRE